MSVFTKTKEGSQRLLPRQPANFALPNTIVDPRIIPAGPQFAGKKVRVHGARAAGIRYEKKIHEEMLRRYPKHYVNNPWIRFIDGMHTRWCQPDGLLIDHVQGQIIIVEVKYRHTGEAWWKLQKLYLPVLTELFGADWTYRCVEIVRWYEADTIFPHARLCEHVHMAPPLPDTGIHICTP